MTTECFKMLHLPAPSKQYAGATFTSAPLSLHNVRYPDEPCPDCAHINAVNWFTVTGRVCAGPYSTYWPGCHAPAFHACYQCAGCGFWAPVRNEDSLRALTHLLKETRGHIKVVLAT